MRAKEQKRKWDDDKKDGKNERKRKKEQEDDDEISILFILDYSLSLYFPTLSFSSLTLFLATSYWEYSWHTDKLTN